MLLNKNAKRTLNKIAEPRFAADYWVQLQKLQKLLQNADAVVIGAGAGLSAAAGFEYVGERFQKYFADFERKYGFHDMYSGGFYPFAKPEEMWAYWSRFIYINRYSMPPKPVYDRLFELVRDKDYFVITTNVDHCFQRAGFDKQRLFYTQGDYGLWQCSEPCCDLTYDNEEQVIAMLKAQGFAEDESGRLLLPNNTAPKMTVPADLLPTCPECGKPLAMNLRADDTFVEDYGWRLAKQRYTDFLLRVYNKRVVYLELGVGFNTPVIIKYPFWRLTAAYGNATYVCINAGQVICPKEIADRSICIDGDIGQALDDMKIFERKAV